MPLSYVSPPQSLLCLFPSSLVLIYTLCLSLPFSMLLSLLSVSFLLSLPLSLSLLLSPMSLLYACPPGLSSVSSAQSLVFFSPPCIFPSIEPFASHHLSSTFSFPLTLPLYLFHSVCPPMSLNLSLSPSVSPLPLSLGLSTIFLPSISPLLYSIILYLQYLSEGGFLSAWNRVNVPIFFTFCIFSVFFTLLLQNVKIMRNYYLSIPKNFWI